MDKIKISAVSYTNTKPFIYGIEHSTIHNNIEISLDIPSVCATKLINNQVDIGLIPVAVIPLVPNANIISSYCIGSVGAVNSVFIFSDVPIHQIKTVKLDPQSRTSNHLAKVLLKFHYKIDATFLTEPNVKSDAIVLIGDRTFGQKDQFAYAYDMGEEWFKFTGLPFVYAAWVANKAIPASFTHQFDEALKYGLSQRKQLIANLPVYPGFDLSDYLMNKLDFELNDAKREALKLFLHYINELDN